MKGIVYTVAIYFLVLIIFQIYLLSFSAKEQINQQDIYLNEQKEILQNLDEISRILKNRLELDTYSYRNNTTILFRIESKGFPLLDYGSYQKNLTEFLEFLNYYSKIRECKINSNLSAINQSGQLLQTNFGINYTQNNSNQSYDLIKIGLNPAAEINKIELKINCSRPAQAAAVSYINWQTTGTTLASNITFVDGVENYNNFVYISQNLANNFSATYYDSNGYMIYKIKLDYEPESNEIKFWSETNSSYTPPYTKINVSCLIEFTALLNSSAHKEIYAYLPADFEIECNNLRYANKLVLFKK
ncbi:MAG: hypothetical protein N3D10_00595 [Candidatus Micrarchaeota archaeon]|nr:hypothetical protein [Candidatus Micrarchaeota archaeon]